MRNLLFAMALALPLFAAATEWIATSVALGMTCATQNGRFAMTSKIGGERMKRNISQTTLATIFLAMLYVSLAPVVSAQD